jgi:RNA polymerase sigma-70 factor (ECF subfamily)
MSASPPNADTAPFQVVVDALRRGDDAAWRELLGRYSERLIRLARSRLFTDALRQKVDPEDVVQSVLRTFYRRNRDGRFDLPSWDALWGLLMTLTVYRVARLDRHFSTLSRDPRREVPLAAVPADGDDRASALAPPVDPHPRPDEVAELLETVRDKLRHLPESQRRVVELGLLGLDDDAIGAQAGRTRVRVAQIREDMARELAAAVDGLPRPEPTP